MAIVSAIMRMARVTGVLLCFPWHGMAQTAEKPALACAKCHVQAISQPDTYMAHALELANTSRILTSHDLLETKVGNYSYKIERRGDRSIYTVSDGLHSQSMDIRWAMGADLALGQTYILEKDGQLYESRVSWFRELNGLGPTLGSGGSVPSSLMEAAGRQMTHVDKMRCFGCHATNANDGRNPTLDTLVPGVQCQHCHTAADQHLAAILHRSEGPIFPPGLKGLHDMSAEQAANFCGQCHRTWDEIARQGPHNIGNVRFQPYRLTNSKCFDPDDKRISCTACHDPHQQTVSDAVAYDSKCQACHGGTNAKAGAKLCPVSKTKCVTCHMPRVDLPGAHYQFVDHRIRIVKPNEPYPG